MGAKSSVVKPPKSAWADVYDPSILTLPNGDPGTNGYLFCKDGVIPVELLEIIFSECSMDDLLNVAQVCRLWKDRTVQVAFWKLIFKKYNMKPDLIPTRITEADNSWIVMRTACKTGVFERNLIHNPSGESGFAGWERDQVPGLFQIENPVDGCAPLPPDREFNNNNSAFACSYLYNSMLQRVDLWREGLTPAVMELIGPFEVRFSIVVGTRNDCGGTGHFLVVFGEHIGPRRLLAEIDLEHSAAGPWKVYSFSAFFENSNPRVFAKVRYLEFGFGGKDNQFWAGSYGLKFTRASMRVKLLSTAEVDSPDEDYHRFPITFGSDPLTL